jgi:DNA (cytosine-5)-methyltransferase 1
MNELHLFAGVGGGILGGMLLGHTPVCAVEIEPYCRKVLLQRQRDSILPRFPIWDDIRTFDGRDWQGKVDIVCGGFPCQDISAAGKGAGIEGERSGLWKEMARVVGEIRPSFVFVENSPMLTIRGLGRVLGDFSEMGYDARWCVMGADDMGAPHKRKRIWILANARHECRRHCIGKCLGENEQRRFQTAQWEDDSTPTSRPSATSEIMANSELFGFGRRVQLAKGEQKTRNLSKDLSDSIEFGCRSCSEDVSNPGLSRFTISAIQQRQRTPRRANTWRVPQWWQSDPADEAGSFESELGRVAYGVAHRVDRFKAIGNGQVPLVAAKAFEFLMRKIYDDNRKNRFNK